MPHGCPGTRRNYGREHEPTTNIHTTGVPRHTPFRRKEERNKNEVYSSSAEGKLVEGLGGWATEDRGAVARKQSRVEEEGAN